MTWQTWLAICGGSVLAVAGVFGLVLARMSGLCERQRERWEAEHEHVTAA